MKDVDNFINQFYWVSEEKIKNRLARVREKGQPLDAFDDRNWIEEASEELIDALQYLTSEEVKNGVDFSAEKYMILTILDGILDADNWS